MNWSVSKSLLSVTNSDIDRYVTITESLDSIFNTSWEQEILLNAQDLSSLRLCYDVASEMF